MTRTTKDQFYKSKKWQKFREVVIAERALPDGTVLCEECGKPIVRRYDLVVHHKTPVTEQNCDDAEITLNPRNVEIVHYKCHNKIHQKGWKNGLRPESRVVLVWGAPCSGKSTYVESVKEPGDLVVDVDSIWEAVSGCERYVKPDSLKEAVFSVRDCLYDSVRYRNGRWKRAFVIAGVPTLGERERLMKRVDADSDIFIESTYEECVERCSQRPDEWLQYVGEWFERYQPPPGSENAM